MPRRDPKIRREGPASEATPRAAAETVAASGAAQRVGNGRRARHVHLIAPTSFCARDRHHHARDGPLSPKCKGAPTPDTPNKHDRANSGRRSRAHKLPRVAAAGGGGGRRRQVSVHCRDSRSASERSSPTGEAALRALGHRLADFFFGGACVTAAREPRDTRNFFRSATPKPGTRKLFRTTRVCRPRARCR